MRRVMIPFYLTLFCGWPQLAQAQQPPSRPPVIDVHLHAMGVEALRNFGPNPITRAAPPRSVEEHVRRTLAEMQKYNVVLGIVGGTNACPGNCGEDVARFVAAAPERVWGSAAFGRPDLDVDSLRAQYAARKILAMGEVLAQYEGLSPSDSAFEPYWDLAEKLDIPVGIHTGLSFPGITQRGAPNFRVAYGDPMLLEGMLNRHPKLRVFIMHGGHPFLAETLGILHIYPQVYVDIAIIDWGQPREEFYAWLKALIRAGFADRIMFGSDQMVWPDAIGLAINAIESAEFLTAQQKRDIFYNNAARFLKLSPEIIARHHGH
ncbi:MAG TPA: amidohydrolase family protein [Longimicrobiales bacterium]